MVAIHGIAIRSPPARNGWFFRTFFAVGVSTTLHPHSVRLRSGLVAGSLALVAAAGLTLTGDRADAQSTPPRAYTVALIGDYNYGPLDGPLWQESERMVVDINKAKPLFAIHNGDIKAGSSECVDEIVAATKAQFDRFTMPLVYLFGDNEWTDCHRILATKPTSRFGDPLERLDNLRTTFYRTNRSQGQNPLTLTRQADVDPQFQTFVENVRWMQGPVLYIGLNIPGSNNNSAGAPGSKQLTRPLSTNEFRVREPATIKWINDSFDEAKRVKARGVVVALQGNPDFENKNPDLPTYDNDGYKRFIKTIQNEAYAFSGEVVVTHGDSHTQHVDQPVTQAIDVRDPFDRSPVIKNLIRVETFGNPETHWVKMTVDPIGPKLFTFDRMIVAGNPIPKAAA